MTARFVWILISLVVLSLNSCASPNVQAPGGTPNPACSTPGIPEEAGFCAPSEDSASPVTPLQPGSSSALGIPIPATPSPTGAVGATAQRGAESFPIQLAPPTLSPRQDPTASTAAPGCLAEQCTYADAFPLAAPISPPGNDQVDSSYRFGSTQGKKRDPHHGVEFLNPRGTEVLAAADGKVTVAGDDKNQLYSPYLNFYGNLVVIQHDLTDDRLSSAPLYTLYAHLDEILVKPGEQVHQGQAIGLVGMTGGATGSHLHFEVRLGENTYSAAHNPELWLQPGLDETGLPRGALAGRVVDSQGKPVAVKGIVIQHLPDGPEGGADWEIYLDSYEEKALLGRPPWRESFAVSSLAAGWYRISFPYFGMQRLEVQVFPNKLTIVEFQK